MKFKILNLIILILYLTNCSSTNVIHKNVALNSEHESEFNDLLAEAAQREIENKRKVKGKYLSLEDRKIYFSTGTHGDIIKESFKNGKCISPLNKAIYIQDLYHQRLSKAHFDNCTFESGMHYISVLSEESLNCGKDVECALFKAGQAIHAIQDFFAHSNYVELNLENDFEKIIANFSLWEIGGKREIDALVRNNRLVSGVVVYGDEKVCPAGTPSHWGEEGLAKDSNKSAAGAKFIKKWNRNQHSAAKELSLMATRKYLLWLFKQSKILNEVCDENHIIVIHASDLRRE